MSTTLLPQFNPTLPTNPISAVAQQPAQNQTALFLGCKSDMVTFGATNTATEQAPKEKGGNKHLFAVGAAAVGAVLALGLGGANTTKTAQVQDTAFSTQLAPSATCPPTICTLPPPTGGGNGGPGNHGHNGNGGLGNHHGHNGNGGPGNHHGHNGNGASGNHHGHNGNGGSGHRGQ